MDERLRPALGREVAVYGVATGLVQLVALVSAPVYTRELGPAGYGVVELLAIASSLIVSTFADGFGLSAGRLYFEDDDPEGRRSVLSTALLSSLAMTGIIAAVVAVVAGPVAAALLGRRSYAGALALAAWAVPAGVAARSTADVLRYQRRPWAYLVTTVAMAALSAATAITLLLAFDRGVSAVYAGLLVAGVTTAALNLRLVRGAIGLRVSRLQLGRIIRFGWPLLPTILAGWGLNLADRLVLARFESLAQVGFYAVANKLVLPMFLLSYAFTNAWLPHTFATTSSSPEEAAARDRAEIGGAFVAVMAAAAVTIGLLGGPLVELLAGSSFRPAADLVPVLAAAGWLFSTLSVTQAAILEASRTRDLAVMAVAAAVVNIAGCFVLIPPFGTIGAAIATLVGWGTQAVLYFRRSQRLRPTPYDLRRIGVIAVVSTAFLALTRLDLGVDAPGAARRAGLVCCYLAVLIISGLLPVRRVLAMRRRRERPGPLNGS
jgi:O-antigen/teichoic acid export membrane protein